MRRTDSAKFVVTVLSNKKDKTFKLLKICDNRTNEDRTEEMRKKFPTLESGFLDLSDVKETLNYLLYGDSQKFKFKWGPGGKETQEGYAYIFD